MVKVVERVVVVEEQGETRMVGVGGGRLQAKERAVGTVGLEGGQQKARAVGDAASSPVETVQ